MSLLSVNPADFGRPRDAEVLLRGVRFDALTEDGTIRHVREALDEGRGGWIVTPNLDILRRAGADREFNELIHQANLRVADGMPLIWASRLMGRRLPERVAGSSLVSTMAAMLAQTERSLYLLGGSPGAADGAAEELRRRYPLLNIVGTDCPPMGFEKDPDIYRSVQDKVVAAAPDVVYVGLGSPKQEHLIRDFRSQLPGTWWAGIGVSFSFLTGDVKRAPSWMQRLGLEWTHRLAQEPGRLWRRYLVDGLPFAARLMAGAAVDRFRTVPRDGTRQSG